MKNVVFNELIDIETKDCINGILSRDVDPLKKAKYLSRVGFRFTEKQKEQIEQFQTIGKIDNAEKIFIDEIQMVYG